MAGRLLSLFDGQGLRPGVVVLSAVVGVLAGGTTLIVSAIVVLALAGSSSATWWVLVAWLLAATQVTAAVLLIVGGMRLAMGVGRSVLVAGATLELLACAAYLAYTVTVVLPDPDEPPATGALMMTVALVFALMAAATWFGATRRTATEYLRLS